MNSFVSGLLSRRMRARDDLDQYHSGMRQALNGTVLAHGGFMRRSGSVFVAEVKNRTGDNALIPFDVATDQQYVMEVGHNYIRYYANHGQVESAPSTPLETVTTYGNGEQQDIAVAQQVDTMYMVHANGHPYKLTRASLTSFSWTKVAWKDGNAPMQPSNITAVTCTKTGVVLPTPSPSRRSRRSVVWLRQMTSAVLCVSMTACTKSQRSLRLQ